MSDELNRLNQGERIAAYTDGELSPEQSMHLMKELAGDPNGAGRIMHQHQLKQSVAKVMIASSIEAPADLRAKITVMAETLPSSMPEQTIEDERVNSHRPDVIARIGRWMPAAVAAVLFIGAATLYTQMMVIHPNEHVTANVMTASLVERFRSRHMECCKDPEKMMQQFHSPTDIESLPGALEDYFGQPLKDTPPLDLEVMGYQFAKAGNCLIPGMEAVHMIYKPKPETSYQGSISLWIRPNDGSLELAEGKLYTARGLDETRPLLMWQTGGVVYYLIGDSMTTVRQAANILASDRG